LTQLSQFVAALEGMVKNMGSFKAEGYKLCFNLSFYFCFVCILVPSIIGVFLIDPKKRIARETELFSYIFLMICTYFYVHEYGKKLCIRANIY